MRFRWQYQALAQPVQVDVIPEEITSDKWTPTYPDMLLPKAALLAAIVAGAFFAPPEVSLAAPEDVQLDKWQPNYPNRLDPAPRGCWYEGLSVIDPLQLTLPETTQLDKWEPKYPNRLDPLARPFWSGWTSVDNFYNLEEPSENPVMFDWPAQIEQPVQTRKYPVQEGLNIYPFPVIKEPELLQWQQPQSQPTRRLERPLWEGINIIDPFLRTQGENVFVDGWLVRVIDPVDWRYYPDSPYFLFTQNYQTPPEPPPHGKPEKARDIPKKAWWQPQSQPIRPRHLVREGVFEPRTIEPILSPPETEVGLDKWFVSPNQPYLVVPRLTELGWIVTDPSAYATAEEIGFDKWFTPIVQPYLTTPRLVELGWITSEPPGLRYETITLDKWFSPIIQPILAAAKLTEQGWIAVDPGILRAELVTPDKWEPRLPTIYSPRPRWEWLYPSVQGDPYLTHTPSVTIAGIAVNDSPVYLLLGADKSLYLLDSSTGTTHRVIVNDRKRE